MLAFFASLSGVCLVLNWTYSIFVVLYVFFGIKKALSKERGLYLYSVSVQIRGWIARGLFFRKILNLILSIYFWQLKYTGLDPGELFLKNTCFFLKNLYTKGAVERQREYKIFPLIGLSFFHFLYQKDAR